ncbi:MAG: class I SAM-dependent methyltransferase [Rickettsiales bacterium]|jgi:SAM-dependent methyltransferase|nr:class I SAM-dependent methyltransferase [Rickettsiales bacterium]
MKLFEKRTGLSGRRRGYFCGVKIYSLPARKEKKNIMLFPESKIAHRYLDGLYGIEIGAASYQPFGLRTINVNYSDDYANQPSGEKFFGNKAARVDIIANGDDLPFKDGVLDFVLSSHVLEHFFDPIKAVLEWRRVLKPGGILFMIVPYKDRMFDKDKERTKLAELAARHKGEIKLTADADEHTHHSFWITQDVAELVNHCGGFRILETHDVDDTRHDGFIVVAEKI